MSNSQLYCTVLGYIPFGWDMSQDDYEHCLWNIEDLNSGTNLYYFSKVPNVNL